MAAFHCLGLPNTLNPCRVEPANDGVYFALPTTKTEIGIWSFQSLHSDPLALTGHRQPISSVCFGYNASPKLLCSAATDYVIVWNVHSAREKFRKGERIIGQIIGTTLGDVTDCCFSVDDSLVAACVHSKVFVLKSNSQSVIAKLDGHAARITKAAFCPHYTSTLVTISDDRTYKVWDVKALSLVYESSILTSSSLISLAMNWVEPNVSIGSSDGIVRVYDLTDGNNFRSLCQIDVAKAIAKARDKRQKQKQKNERQETVTVTKRGTWEKNKREGLTVESETKEGQAVVALSFAYSAQKESGQSGLFQNTQINKVLESEAPVLIITSTGGLLQINSKTHEILQFVDLHEPISNLGDDSRSVIVNTSEMANVVQSPGTSVLWGLVGTMFQNETHIIQLGVSKTNDTRKNIDFDDSLTYVISGVSDLEASLSDLELNMVARAPLGESSPLKSELLPTSPTQCVSLTKSKPPGRSIRKPDPMNQPLTFKPKVRSSGYTQAPRMTMFKPKINKTKPQNSLVKKSGSENKLLSEYPADCGPPSEIENKLNVSERPTPVNMISFSDDGKNVACALGNKTASLYKAPIGQNSSHVLVGHNNSVNSARFNHSGCMLITASDDKTATVWAKASSEPILKFTTVSNNFEVDKDTTKQDKNNAAFPKEIKHAQFFYMDKFVLLTCGGSLHLYKYYLDATRDEIRRYLTKSRYKLVQNWLTQSQTITAMAAVNSFYSHLVICAGSNRDIEVFDLNQGSLATAFEDSHTRPIHSLSINEGSSYSSQTTSAYNLFASAAPADCIKLWDMRSQRCVQRLEGHLNKAHACGHVISPCGRFLASGSEDRLVYVFDLRSGTYCERLRGHTDVVTDVAFNPAKPVLVSGSLDGRIVSHMPE